MHTNYLQMIYEYKHSQSEVDKPVTIHTRCSLLIFLVTQCVADSVSQAVTPLKITSILFSFFFIKGIITNICSSF